MPPLERRADRQLGQRPGSFCSPLDAKNSCSPALKTNSPPQSRHTSIQQFSFLPACTVEAVQSGQSDALPSCSPLRTFVQNGSALKDAPRRLIPDRSLLLRTAFRSAKKIARFRTTLPASMLLAYPFGSSCESSPNPFGPPLAHVFRLAPEDADSNATDPLSGSLSHGLGSFFQPALPFRAFRPFPIKAPA